MSRHWIVDTSCLNAYHCPKYYNPLEEFPGTPPYPSTVNPSGLISILLTPCLFSTFFMTFPRTKLHPRHDTFSSSLQAQPSNSGSLSQDQFGISHESISSLIASFNSTYFTYASFYYISLTLDLSYTLFTALVLYLCDIDL